MPLATSLGLLALVLLGAALVLSELDAALAYATGRPRGVVRVASLDEAGARLGARLLVPAYFPAGLEWPPAEVALSGRPAAVCLTFRSVETRRPAAILCQSARGAADIPNRLLPAASPFHSLKVSLDGTEGTLSVFHEADGSVWQDLEMWRDGSRVVLRFHGGTERFLRLAASLRRGRS